MLTMAAVARCNTLHTAAYGVRNVTGRSASQLEKVCVESPGYGFSKMGLRVDVRDKDGSMPRLVSRC